MRLDRSIRKILSWACKIAQKVKALMLISELWNPTKVEGEDQLRKVTLFQHEYCVARACRQTKVQQ